MKTRKLTLERLRAVLSYDAETGNFSRGDKMAGSRHKAGYIVITIDRVQHSAHRLAWLYVYGDWPSGDLDHANCDKADNRIENLRVCNDSTNQANRSVTSANKSGRKGVSWNASCCKWQAGIKRAGKSYHLGLFDDLNAAAEAYRAAAIEQFGSFARAA